MIDHDKLRVEVAGETARVTLTRPDVHNAFDDELVDLLTRAARELAAAPGVRVVILASEGRSFCAGADLHWMKRMVDYSHEENVRDAEAMAAMFEAWHGLPKPVVGRIQGAALGGGVGLVSVTDIAIAATGAVFGFTEVRLGILPAVISPFAVEKIGKAAARDLFLTGERVSAERAKEIGLVQRVVEPEELDTEVEKIVGWLLSGGPEAQATIKRLIHEVAGRPVSEARPITADTIARARASAEGQEGMASFLERRKPSWRRDV